MFLSLLVIVIIKLFNYQGFEEVNVSIQGCFSTGKWSRDDVQGVSVYKETHVINVVNGSINKVSVVVLQRPILIQPILS